MGLTKQMILQRQELREQRTQDNETNVNYDDWLVSAFKKNLPATKTAVRGTGPTLPTEKCRV